MCKDYVDDRKLFRVIELMNARVSEQTSCYEFGLRSKENNNRENFIQR